MPKFMAVWIAGGISRAHLKPVEASNYQVLLDDAEKHKIIVTRIFDTTDEDKEPKLVYSHPVTMGSYQEICQDSPSGYHYFDDEKGVCLYCGNPPKPQNS